MKFTIYAKPGEHFDEIRDSIASILPSDTDLILVRSISELERQLRDYHLNDMVTLLVPDPSGDLPMLYGLQELLRGVRLVILLPSDCSTEFLTCAHSLYPRYLCFQPHGLDHLGRVIQNLCLGYTAGNHRKERDKHLSRGTAS